MSKESPKTTPHFNAMVAARGGAGQTAAGLYPKSAGITTTPDFNRQTAGNGPKKAPPAPKAWK